MIHVKHATQKELSEEICVIVTQKSVLAWRDGMVTNAYLVSFHLNQIFIKRHITLLFLLTPNQGGLFGRSIKWGGTKVAHISLLF